MQVVFHHNSSLPIRRFLLTFFLVMSVGFTACKKSGEVPKENVPTAEPRAQESKVEVKGVYMVELETSEGKIVLELDAAKAPKTVSNFIEYAKAGFYDGTIFHRVIDGFMIQGGGFDAELNQKKTRAPIQNEAQNGLSNKPMTVAMARTNDPNSATAQFFINLADNSRLDYSAGNAGYAVFGKVVQGEDVVKKIGKVQTTTKSVYSDVPAKTVTIKKVTVADKK